MEYFNRSAISKFMEITGGLRQAGQAGPSLQTTRDGGCCEKLPHRL